MRLTACGPVIGLLTDTSYEQQKVVLEPGDILLTYTDGISEAMSIDEEEWGEERLEQTVRRGDGRSADELIKRVFEEVDQFTVGAPQFDDMTLLLMRLGADGAR